MLFPRKMCTALSFTHNVFHMFLMFVDIDTHSHLSNVLHISENTGILSVKCFQLSSKYFKKSAQRTFIHYSFILHVLV